jgi:hypothetical protein
LRNSAEKSLACNLQKHQKYKYQGKTYQQIAQIPQATKIKWSLSGPCLALLPNFIAHAPMSTELLIKV